MSDWFTPRELAGLPGVPGTPQGITARAKRERWVAKRRAGSGGGREYSFESLPEQTRTAIVLRRARAAAAPTDQPCAKAGPTSEELWDWFERRPGSVQEEAKRRLAAIVAIDQLVATGIGKTAATSQVADEFGVATASLHRWRRAIRDVAPGDRLPALAPGWAGRRATAEISEEAWDFFKALYLRPEAPSITHCYNLLSEAAPEHGWSIPSQRTITRRVRQLDPRVVTLLREGESALVHKMLPAQERTVAHLHAMQWLNGDGYQHNVRVRFPSGEEGRPKTWFWQDVRTRKIVGYQPDESENSDQIRRALGRVIEQYGIPEYVTIDNTRAAANKPLTGRADHRHRFTARTDDAIGVIPQLGIEVHWTSIVAGTGHGQAKPVERAFGVGGLGEYVDKHPRFAGAYTGPNTQQKPHNYGERVLEWDEFLAGLADGVRRWNALPNRRTEICAGQQSFDEAFRESYDQNAHRIRKPTAAQRRLWLMPAESVTVKRDGSIVLRAGEGRDGRNRYSAECLYRLAGQKVVVRFDPDRLHDPVHVYELAGRYVGAAECIQATGFDSLEGGKRYGRDKQRLRKTTKERAAIELRMDQAHAIDLMPETEAPADPEQKVVRAAFAPHATDEDQDEEVDVSGGFDSVVSTALRRWLKSQA